MFNYNSISLATDEELRTLIIKICEEQERRKIEEARLRENWVKAKVHAYLTHPNANCLFVGNRTIVSLYSRNTGTLLGTSYPIHGDVPNRDVGIAVAYAKAMGETIPDFI